MTDTQSTERRREIARRAYDRLHAEGKGDDGEVFETLFREEADIAGIPPILIMSGVDVANRLYRRWRDEGVERAPVVPMVDEPRFEDGDG